MRIGRAWREDAWADLYPRSDDKNPALCCMLSAVTFSIDLFELQEGKLRQRAKSLGTAPGELARVAISGLLKNQADAERAFEKTKKNPTIGWRSMRHPSVAEVLHLHPSILP